MLLPLSNMDVWCGKHLIRSSHDSNASAPEHVDEILGKGYPDHCLAPTFRVMHSMHYGGWPWKRFTWKGFT